MWLDNLEREFTIQLWLDKLPHSRLDFWNGGTSDHSVMFLILSQVEQGAKPFKIYSFWFHDQEFLELTRKGLTKTVSVF